MKKWVYFFGAGKAEGDGEWRDVLGGKGAGLAEMTKIGLPVPAGFTISTEACDYFYKNGKKYPAELAKQVKDNVAKLEKVTKKKLGDPNNPLLVSVRSGSARSMPGMMETILNLGLTDKSVKGLAGATKNERFAYDAYRRFVQMYSTVVMGLSKEDLEHRLRDMKQRRGVKNDTDVPADGWKELVAEYKAYFKEKAGNDFPDDPMEQLWGAIGAVFGSWMAEKAVTYRRVEKITGLLGTAVNVVQMVFGNTGDNSGTGVCFTRDPSSGEKVFYGDYLTNAQGEDVVAGIRTPVHLTELAKIMPKAYAQLEKVRVTLEKHYKDMQDMEFTDRRRQAVHAADAHRQAHARSDLQDRHGHGQREVDHQGRSGAAHQAGRYRAALLSGHRRQVRQENPAGEDPDARNRRSTRRGGWQGVLQRSGRRRVGQERREGDSRAARNQPRRCGRHGRGAGNSHCDRRKDLARGGGGARLGQVLHRWRGVAGHRLQEQVDEGRQDRQNRERRGVAHTRW